MPWCACPRRCGVCVAPGGVWCVPGPGRCVRGPCLMVWARSWVSAGVTLCARPSVWMHSMVTSPSGAGAGGPANPMAQVHVSLAQCLSLSPTAHVLSSRPWSRLDSLALGPRATSLGHAPAPLLSPMTGGHCSHSPHPPTPPSHFLRCERGGESRTKRKENRKGTGAGPFLGRQGCGSASGCRPGHSPL